MRRTLCSDHLLLVAKGSNREELRAERCKTPGCKYGPKDRSRALKGIAGGRQNGKHLQIQRSGEASTTGTRL